LDRHGIKTNGPLDVGEDEPIYEFNVRKKGTRAIFVIETIVYESNIISLILSTEFIH
jgi:hypothetical protein